MATWEVSEGETRFTVTRRRGHAGAVPLFGLEAPRVPRRVLPALERTFMELRRLDVDEGPTGPTIRAVTRTLAEVYDQRDATGYAMANMARTLVDLVRVLAGEDTGAASFDELRALLSTPPIDGEDGPT